MLYEHTHHMGVELIPNYHYVAVSVGKRLSIGMADNPEEAARQIINVHREWIKPENRWRLDNCYAHIHDLTHGNKKKTDRIIWALQGRFEHGRIVLNSEEDWDEFIDQLLLFPSKGVHDDLCDALSYVDQIAVTTYFEGDNEDDWEPIDVISGV